MKEGRAQYVASAGDMRSPKEKEPVTFARFGFFRL
jgi:hypothetical protein